MTFVSQEKAGLSQWEVGVGMVAGSAIWRFSSLPATFGLGVSAPLAR
jgi:hypothetical protein